MTLTKIEPIQTLPLVFIIVLNWNSKDDTLECLKSLDHLNYPNYRVLVVDNGSTDGTEEAVRSSFPPVTVIQTGRNLGYAGGNNVGIKLALSQGADYVWLLNNDTVVDTKSLTALIEVAEADPSIAFVGSKIYFYEKPNVIWCVGGTIDLAAGARTDHPGIGQEDLGQFDRNVDVGYVTGCSLLARKNVISTLGLLPEEYFLYFEETDWNIAAQRKGFRTVMAPTSHVWHKYEEAGDYRKRFLYYSFRNRIHIVRKYAPQHTLKAFFTNMRILKRYLSLLPQKALSLCFIAFLAHFDALWVRMGPARWRAIK